jgi:CBS domain-containing protein
MAAGWISVLRGTTGGLWLVAIGLFITLVAGAERQQAVLRTALQGVRVSDAMSSPVITGADWLTVGAFLDETAARSGHSAVPLLDFEGRPSGIVETRRLAAIPAEGRDGLRVRDVAVPLAQCVVAAPDDLLTDVLDRAGPGAGTRILVLDAGRPVGIVTAEDISRLVRRHTPRGRGGG